MPKITKEMKNIEKTAKAAGEIIITESEKYHQNREYYFQGKRVTELPQENLYIDFDSQTK